MYEYIQIYESIVRCLVKLIFLNPKTNRIGQTTITAIYCFNMLDEYGQKIKKNV